MLPHGAQAVPVADVDGVKVFLRERVHKVSKLDFELHSAVLPRDLTLVRELQYRFSNGLGVVGDAIVWVYDGPTRTALILDYWCNIPDLYTRLLKYLLDDLKLHYNVRTVYLHAVRSDENEKRLLGKTLRDLGFTMLDEEYAVLVL